MKFSEAWLREWVNPSCTREELCATLTMGGLEVEELAPVAAEVSGVVVGQIKKINPHPDADKLTICTVDVGSQTPLTIVCGAPNVKAEMKVAVAQIDARLSNDLHIKPSKIRGVESQGMLCSASELGLSDDNSGLLVLGDDAKLGEDLRRYLNLDDYTIEVGLTPNRGDCLSILGMAREVAALTHTQDKKPSAITTKVTKTSQLEVSIKFPAGCPRYTGRIIRDINTTAQTPMWLKERLRRSGIRSIHPVVDVTNYVMLELGQPMHAFDLETIQGDIQVRHSNAGEKIKLLDDSEKVLDAETMVIADQQHPLAIAGVMGGVSSSVTAQTKHIFLESAYFTAPVIARQRQYYHLNSDSAYRFERGVDPEIQLQALERATQLILEIAGGDVEEVIEVVEQKHLPTPATITLTSKQIQDVLGVAIPNADVEKFFTALQFTFQPQHAGWQVKVPSYRFDLTIAEDLIEEVARLYGYNHIPTHPIKGELQVNATAIGVKDLSPLRLTLSNHGYHEIISYSFVAKDLQQLLNPAVTPIELLNPITADMTVMRTNMWPGLLTTLQYNKARQQHRVRLFEIGTVFQGQLPNQLQQQTRLAGLVTGLATPEQWGLSSRKVDFYDVKGDLESILSQTYGLTELEFVAEQHPALHPGQTAAIFHAGSQVGLLGALHPQVLQALDLTENVFLFELNLDLTQQAPQKTYQDISKFPEIRRDIAILVKQAVPAKEIQATIKVIAGDWLKDVFIFDVYHGKGISPGLKSIALGMVLQHPTRTLVDAEVTELMDRVIDTLKGQLGAELRR